MSHLILIREPPAGEPPRRKWTRGPTALTEAEQRHGRAALRALRSAYGAWGVVAELMGFTRGAVMKLVGGTRSLNGEALIRIAKARSMSVDAILAGTLRDASRCPHCGQRRSA
ncbi:MAG: hypothetical protein HUU21_12965 [Polyangiaceae bacterium]|nr:hypothetical protein [Polyangiaceae bacterium]